ncbi:hypothetical protein [Paraburkholderia phenazinium]|uniref:Uncharacterized protein n=1 Tax=Paraburkholderia phenazinium TaxID=60549 RepID=A0A1N6KG62_9BURK|nr:hypothetical protein [Paraburkholderia phenazinium]SIO55562.1 hypothetical protein SAMN05444165_3576 [Paraburkholderia phenazinium]
MSHISLLKAFSILRNGSDYQIGEGHNWKRGVLNTAIGLLVAFPIANMLNALPYRGAIPPEAPLIKSVGNFTGEHTYSSKAIQRYTGIFHAADGRSYPVQDGALNSSHEIMSNMNSGKEFYVEGFVLEDGQGFFWPTLVTMTDGRALLSREKMSKNLKSNREPFGEILIWEYAATLPLWAISLSNAIKLKKNLSRVN